MERIWGKDEGKGWERDRKGKKNKLRIRTFINFFKRGGLGRISKERMNSRVGKKRGQIKESNGSGHWEGFKLMRKKGKGKSTR